MTTSTLRIATRRSQLALWQAEHVAALLREAHPGLNVVLVPMVTQGDRIQDRALAEVGGKGLFIKELEVAMAEDRADLAVHSMKDVPADLPPGYAIVCVLPRADARDAFLSVKYPNFAALPKGAKVGTSSQRRQCILRSARPDLEIVQLRGNVDTRLRKLDAGEYDAIILAAAGLTRLGWGQRITEYLDLGISVPAVGQGVIGIECRDTPEMHRWLAPLNHGATRQCLVAERAYAARLEGSCQSPIAGHARFVDGALRVEGLVGSPDGKRVFRDVVTGGADDGESLGRTLADRLLAAGAGTLLAELRGG
jgi:hydroxymethylbilane synthase